MKKVVLSLVVSGLGISGDCFGIDSVFDPSQREMSFSQRELSAEADGNKAELKDQGFVARNKKAVYTAAAVGAVAGTAAAVYFFVPGASDYVNLNLKKVGKKISGAYNGVKGFFVSNGVAKPEISADLENALLGDIQTSEEIAALEPGKWASVGNSVKSFGGWTFDKGRNFCNWTEAQWNRVPSVLRTGLVAGAAIAANWFIAKYFANNVVNDAFEGKIGDSLQNASEKFVGDAAKATGFNFATTAGDKIEGLANNALKDFKFGDAATKTVETLTSGALNGFKFDDAATKTVGTLTNGALKDFNFVETSEKIIDKLSRDTICAVDTSNKALNAWLSANLDKIVNKVQDALNSGEK